MSQLREQELSIESFDPYSSPKTRSGLSAGTLTFGIWHWGAVAAAMMLVATAVYHRSLQNEIEIYRRSPAIGLEFIALFGTLIAFLCHLSVAVLGILIPGKRRFALASFFVCLLIWGAVAFAMWIDSPTLLYAT